MSETVRIREIEVKVSRRAVVAPEPITGPEGVAAFVREAIGDEPREHLVALYLDGRHQPIGYQVVSIGTATASLVHPREVFQPAVALGACALVLAHNHPSGDPRPSREDLDVTSRVAAAGQILGIVLLDHVVVGTRGCTSIREVRADLFAE